MYNNNKTMIMIIFIYFFGLMLINVLKTLRVINLTTTRFFCLMLLLLLLTNLEGLLIFFNNIKYNIVGLLFKVNNQHVYSCISREEIVYYGKYYYGAVFTCINVYFKMKTAPIFDIYRIIYQYPAPDFNVFNKKVFEIIAKEFLPKVGLSDRTNELRDIYNEGGNIVGKTIIFVRYVCFVYFFVKRNGSVALYGTPQGLLTLLMGILTIIQF